jgi:hypothetical protein
VPGGARTNLGVSYLSAQTSILAMRHAAPKWGPQGTTFPGPEREEKKKKKKRKEKGLSTEIRRLCIHAFLYCTIPGWSTCQVMYWASPLREGRCSLNPSITSYDHIANIPNLPPLSRHFQLLPQF